MYVDRMARREAGLLGIIVAIVVGACGKTSHPRLLSCEQLFAPPSKGELLCDEHVMPSNDVRGEIHWRSYGLPEERGAYCDPYINAAQSCGFGWAIKPPVCDVTDNKGRRVELFFGNPTGFGGADYPKCARAPDPKHRTIVVVSEGPR